MSLRGNTILGPTHHRPPRQTDAPMSACARPEPNLVHSSCDLKHTRTESEMPASTWRQSRINLHCRTQSRGHRLLTCQQPDASTKSCWKRRGGNPLSLWTSDSFGITSLSSPLRSWTDRIQNMHSPALHSKWVLEKIKAQRNRWFIRASKQRFPNSLQCSRLSSWPHISNPVRLPILELIAVPETHSQTQNTCSSSTHHTTLSRLS